MDEAMLHKLADLAQLDRDAVGVYDEALGHVDDDEVKTAFTAFRDEHDHHATVILAAIERLGGTAPTLKVDLMGRLAEFVTTLRSVGGTRGALHAMKTAEQYHNRRYEESTSWKLDDDELETTLLQFFSEEQRHLAFVESHLRAQPAAAQK